VRSETAQSLPSAARESKTVHVRSPVRSVDRSTQSGSAHLPPTRQTYSQSKRTPRIGNVVASRKSPDHCWQRIGRACNCRPSPHTAFDRRCARRLYRQPGSVLLQFVRLAAESAVDNVLQESPEPPRLRKDRAVQNLLQLAPNEFGRAAIHTNARIKLL
jgi:hypothetical protein